MPLPNPQQSRAVLIGTAAYRDLPGLPAVAENLERLLALFTAPDLWGLPADHCQVLLDVEHPAQVLGAVHEAAKAATDTLVVYYAGHGLRDPGTDELFLSLPGSTKDRLFASVRYDDLRKEILRTAADVPSKVVMLDCCYSGTALKGSMGDSAEIADQARIEGTYLMTASASTVVALAPEGERFTAFTGEIVDVFERGIPDGPDLLNMEKLFWHVRTELESKGRPVPQQRAGNSGGLIALVRNRRGAGDGSGLPNAGPRPLPEVPTGFEAVLRSSPLEIAARVDSLRGEGRGDVAVGLLAAIATRRPAQEVAGLLGYLRRSGRREDIDEVLGAVVSGTADHATDLVDTLYEVDQPDDVVGLLAAAARGPAQELAVLAQSLRDGGHPETTEKLLRAALAERLAADGVIALVGALWAAGLGAEVERLLGSSAIRLDSAETLSLAKALDSAGRVELAMTLYMRVLDVVVLQSDEEIAALLRSAREVARAQDADRLIGAALGTRSGAGEYVTFAIALWDAGLEADADRVLDDAAVRLESGDLTQIATRLRSLDRADAALRLYTRAAEQSSGPSVVGFVDALRDLGRPVDGNRLLASSASWAVPKVAALIAELLLRGRQADADRVSAVQAQRPVREIAELADQLQRLDLSGAAELLMGGMLHHISAADAMQLAATLQQAGWSTLAEKAVAALIANNTQGIDTFVAELPGLLKSVASALLGDVSRLPAGLALAVAKSLYDGDQHTASALLVESIPVGAVTELVAEIESQDWPDGIGFFFGVKKDIPLAEITRQYTLLRSFGRTQGAEHLLDAVAMVRDAKEIPALINVLHENDLEEAVDQVIHTVGRLRTPQDFAAVISVLELSRLSLRHRCSGLMEVAATRPRSEVTAIEGALRRAYLNRHADQLIDLSKQNSKNVL